MRVFRAWRALVPQQRLSAIAALSLWITMFLPWYSESPAGVLQRGETALGTTPTAWGAFSFVEAAVLLVSFGVLALLFARGERRAFHLPGGDGGVIMLAGGWTTLLIIYRMFDRSSQRAGDVAITSGIECHLLALAASIWLTWTGLSMRRTHRAEPTLAPDPTVHLRRALDAPRERIVERRRERVAPSAATREAPPRALAHRGVTREDAEQLSFELPDERH